MKRRPWLSGMRARLLRADAPLPEDLGWCVAVENWWGAAWHFFGPTPKAALRSALERLRERQEFGCGHWPAGFSALEYGDRRTRDAAWLRWRRDSFRKFLVRVEADAERLGLSEEAFV